VVQADTGGINTTKTNNSLSTKIREVHAKTTTLNSGSSLHEAPDLTDSAPAYKKLKTDKLSVNKLKTKHELRIENSDLMVRLRIVQNQLEKEIREKTTLQHELSKNQQTTQSLLEKQKRSATTLHSFLSKFSPNKQAIYQEELIDLEILQLQGDLQEVIAGSAEPDSQNLFWDSLESRKITPEKGKEGSGSVQQKKGLPSSQKKRLIEDIDSYFAEENKSERKQEEDEASSQKKILIEHLDSDFAEENKSEREKMEEEEKESFFIDTKVKLVEKAPRQTKSVAHKKGVEKKPWDDVPPGVLILFKAMKITMREGVTENDILDKNKNYPITWRQILDRNHKGKRDYYTPFQAFWKSDTD
jgi:hypothetical protein